jgi:glutathione synthase/RimK-type ligase-like ATP-grasp enzyme
MSPTSPSGDAPSPRVALATCSHFPAGDPDDVDLPGAIEGSEFVVWDDASVDWSAYDVVVLRSTWDYQERRDEYLAWARSVGDRLHNPPAIVAWNTDKAYLKELEDAGLPVVHTELIPPGTAFTPPAGDAEYVVKPTVSAGSRDTARFKGADDAARAIDLVESIHASGRTAMVQPYVASVDERGETALLHFDGAYSHAIHKGALLAPGADPTADVFARETIRPREATAAERALGERALAHVAERFPELSGPLLYARIDVVEDASGEPQILELELTEPSLFFMGEPGRVSQFAAAVARRVPVR